MPVDDPVVFHIDLVHGAIVVQHAAMGQVGKEPALPETGEQFPPCEGDDGSELAVFFAEGVQGAMVAELSYGVEHFVIGIGAGVFALGVKADDAVFDPYHVRLLHQLYIGGAEADVFLGIVQPGPCAHYVTEQGRHFVKYRNVFIFALIKGIDGFIVENAPQGMGGDDIFPVTDQLQYAFVVRGLFRALQIQFPHVALVPFPYGGNEYDKTPGLRIKSPVMETDYVHDGSAFPDTHRRVYDMEFQGRLFPVVFAGIHGGTSFRTTESEGRRRLR